MDILIKNMEMPRNCANCQFCEIGEYFDCLATPMQREIDRMEWIRKGRPKWCPLVALPEHGRLISDTDVKALLRSGLSLDSDPDMDYVCGLIDGLPTIVEASNE